MKIAVNLIPLKGFQGIESYTQNVIRTLAERNPELELCLILKKDSPSFLKEFHYPQLKPFFLSMPKFTKFSGIIMQQFSIYPLLKKIQPDLLFSPTPFMPAFFKRSVVVIHDCAYDRFPEELPDSFRRAFIKGVYLLDKLQALKIITVSEFSKKELLELYKISPNKIEVIYEAAPQLPLVNEELIQKTLQKFSLLNSPYFFYIGSMRPRKNLPKMIEAFQLFSRRHPGYKFVISGKIEKRFYKPLKLVEDYNLNKKVIFTDFVTQEEKAALYKGSLALFFCSLYEGFGLPVLESQSLGVPVITSNGSSLPEVAGSGALYADPKESEDMASKLEEIAFDIELRENLVKKGFENLKRFSWEKTTEDLLRIFSELVQKSSSQ